MTDTPKATATDQQIIGYSEASKLAKWYGCSTADIQKMIAYNDWSMWRKLELKVLEDEELFGIFKTWWMTPSAHRHYELQENIYLYIKSDLPTRFKALLDALDSLPNPNNDYYT